ncbi:MULTISPECIES: lipopolysaccharide kinase InaA family protein [Pseudomonas]|uniref:lipopolysaccharide kinase InaA family protein n=1 Tax=Pseudomonas TaxID=286 RepID=UPI0018A883EA|nr:lipopolysaccharide kinase InaA family protein [Pseudomonas putida]MBF8659520.1 InaA protein [Pseudomonas putida]
MKHVSASGLEASHPPVQAILSAPGVWVEPPNIRRGGESGVLKVELDGFTFYKKQQVGHIYRSLVHPFGYPTVAREAKALRAAAALGVATPLLLHSDVHKQDGEWRAVMVTAGLDGYVSLEDFYLQGLDKTIEPKLHHDILEAYGRALATLNLGRWQHGCLYLKHVFVAFDESGIKIALLDFEKARQRLTAMKASRHDLRQVKRRSDWATAEWEAFCRGYRQVFGMDVERFL